MHEKNTFIFRTEWADVLSDYPPKTRLAVYEAVIHYASTGKVPELTDSLARMAFGFIRNDVDYDNAKFEEACTRRSDAGRKGMASRWGNRQRAASTPSDNKNNKDNNVISVITDDNKDNNVISVITDDNKDNNSDSDSDSDSDSENNIKDAIASSSSFATDDAVAMRRKNFDAKFFVNFWNESCEKNNASLPHIQRVSGRRIDCLRARIREWGEEKVKEAIQKATASDFLNGGGSSGFIASFDWVMRPNNFPKVLEGTYDNRPRQNYSIGTTHIDNSISKWEEEERKWR